MRAPSRSRLAAAAVIAVVALLSGCAAAPTSERGAPAGQGPPRRVRPIVYFAAAAGQHLAFVAVGPGPQGGPAARLLAVAPTGSHGRAIGPPVPSGEWPDSLSVLDRDHIWFTTFNASGSGETLYRTSDGGRHWQSFVAPEHVIAGGSTDEIQFVTPADGWLTDLEPTGPAETLYDTTDGGATWHLVAQLDPSSTTTPALPGLGFVSFEAGGAIGWLGGSPYQSPFPYHGPLETTRDQGRAWQPAAIPTRPGDVAGVPATFGTSLLVPVVRCAGGATELLSYLSSDGGATWSLASAPQIAAGCQQVSTDFPSPAAGWVATLNAGQVRVERSTDHGHSWTAVATPRLRTTFAPSIIAWDARHAWLLVAGLDVHGSRIYATDDAGRSWRRIDQNLTG